MENGGRQCAIRTAREIETRRATSGERELLQRFFQLAGEEKPEKRGVAAEVLLQLFPETGSYAVAKYLRETWVQADTLADRLMDIEAPAEREEFLASCQNLTDRERQDMARRYPYQPLKPEQRLCRKRVSKKGKMYVPQKSPCLSRFYAAGDLEDFCGRQAAVIRFLQANPALGRAEAEEIANVVLEKSVAERRVSIYQLDRSTDNLIYAQPGESKRRRMAAAEGKQLPARQPVGIDMITQEEIDALLNAGFHFDDLAVPAGHQVAEEEGEETGAPVMGKSGTAYYFRDMPAVTAEQEVFDHVLQELGKAIDPLYEAKTLWAEQMRSYELDFSENFIERIGSFRDIIHLQEEPFSRTRLLAPADSVAEAEEKICKYRLLRRLWHQRLSPAHEVRRDLLRRVRLCTDFAAFAALPLSSLEATQLLGLVLEDEIVVPQCQFTLWHSLPVSQAILDAASMFKTSFTRNVRKGAISAVVAADERDFPGETTLLETVTVLDKVLARRLAINQAAGLHKSVVKPEDLRQDDTAREQGKGILGGLRRWLAD